MGIIRASKLIFEYIRRDEEDKIEEINRAVDQVDVDIQQGDFVAILGHNLPLPSISMGFCSPPKGPFGFRTWIQRKKNISGMCERQQVWYSKTRIIRLLEISWRRMWALDRKTWECPPRKSGAGWRKSPNKLSGGQKQRVAIAGVMAMKPQCIVLDEPTAMLDPNGRKEVIRTVRELNHREGITVLLITHYMEEVVEADRVIVMDRGKIVMDGTPKQIFSQVDKLKSYRLDVPQVTELAYELKKGGMPLPDGILDREELLNSLLPLLRS